MDLLLSILFSLIVGLAIGAILEFRYIAWRVRSFHKKCDHLGDNYGRATVEELSEDLHIHL